VPLSGPGLRGPSLSGTGSASGLLPPGARSLAFGPGGPRWLGQGQAPRARARASPTPGPGPGVRGPELSVTAPLARRRSGREPAARGRATTKSSPRVSEAGSGTAPAQCQCQRPGRHCRSVEAGRLVCGRLGGCLCGRLSPASREAAFYNLKRPDGPVKFKLVGAQAGLLPLSGGFVAGTVPSESAPPR
jgi:hypothetical protein